MVMDNELARTMNAGLRAAHNGSYKESIEWFTKAIRINNNIPDAYYSRGLSYLNLGELQEAIADFTKTIEFNSRFLLEALNNRGLANLNARNYNASIRDFTQVLSMDKCFCLAYLNRGTAYCEIGNFASALEDYINAEKYANDELDIWELYTSFGRVYADLKDYESALKYCEKAIELQPNKSECWESRGFVCSRMGKYEEALRNFEKAISFNPNAVEAYHNRGVIYLNHYKDYTRAIEDFKTCIRIEPKYFAAYAKLSKAYAALGDKPNVIDYLRKAFSMMNDDERQGIKDGVSQMPDYQWLRDCLSPTEIQDLFEPASKPQNSDLTPARTNIDNRIPNTGQRQGTGSKKKTQSRKGRILAGVIYGIIIGGVLCLFFDKSALWYGALFGAISGAVIGWRKNFGIVLALLLILVLIFRGHFNFIGSTPESNNGPGSNTSVPITNVKSTIFRVTVGRYSEHNDPEQVVINEFGNDYRMADWNDVIRYCYNNSSAQFVELLAWQVGDGNSLMVTWNGAHFYGGNRHYFISRHDHNRPGNYLAHATIDNNYIDLGSWYNLDMPILCIRK